MDSSIAIRIAACGLVRKRFEGRLALERKVQQGSLLALVQLEERLGLASKEALGWAIMDAGHDRIVANARYDSQYSGPMHRAAERERQIRAGQYIAHGGWCSGGNADKHPTRVSSTTRLSWPRAEATPSFAHRLAAYKAARLAERMKAVLKAIAAVLRPAYEECAYRACSAGHTMSVEIAEAPRVASSKDVDWTKYRDSKGKYRYPEHTSAHSISVRSDWLERVAARGAVYAVLGATEVLVLDVDPTGSASWVRQSRGISIEVQTGWLVRVGSAWRCATSERARKSLMVSGVVEDVRSGSSGSTAVAS